MLIRHCRIRVSYSKLEAVHQQQDKSTTDCKTQAETETKRPALGPSLSWPLQFHVAHHIGSGPQNPMESEMSKRCEERIIQKMIKRLFLHVQRPVSGGLPEISAKRDMRRRADTVEEATHWKRHTVLFFFQ